MQFDFNNQFIKAIRTWLIFQKYRKNILFFLVSGITNLYVKCIPDIKEVFFIDIRTVRFLPDKISISLPRKTFFKP
jgi:hypothetical protein